MTWGEFKQAVEAHGVTAETNIRNIEVYVPHEQKGYKTCVWFENNAVDIYTVTECEHDRR